MPQRITPARSGQTPQPVVTPAGSSRTRPKGSSGKPAGTRVGVQNALATSIRPVDEDRDEVPPDEGPTNIKPSSFSSRLAVKPASGGNGIWILAVATVLLVLLAGGAGAWWLISKAVTGAMGDSAVAENNKSGGYQANYPIVQTNPQPQPGAHPNPEADLPHPGGINNINIQEDHGVRRIKTPHYEAVIERDGCLTSLRVGGIEMLWAGGPVSRGLYLFDNGPLKLDRIEQNPKAPIVIARNDRAELRYEVLEKGFIFKVNQKGDKPIPFYIVFDTSMRAVNFGDGMRKLPVKDSACQLSTWYAGRSWLKMSGVSGGTRTWAPFEKTHQVFEALVSPNQTHEIRVEVGNASDDEINQLTRATGEHPVHTAAYDAIVAGDGCLTSLRIGGTEVLQPDVDVSRGLYLHQEKTGAVKLSEVERSGDVITAKGDQGELRYELNPSSIICTARNSTDKPMSLFIVFSSEVQAMRDAEGEWHSLPFSHLPDKRPEKKWETTSWFTMKSRLSVSGGTTIWGPWSNENLQVWQAVLEPRGSRTVVLSVGGPSKQERARLVALTGGAPPEDVDLQVQLPQDYQVFQRYSRLRGQVQLKGKVIPPCTELEARLSGTSTEGSLEEKWMPVQLNDDRTFDAEVPANVGGWYKVEIRARNKGKTVAEWTVDHVGVGMVFVVAGQSNSTNCGEERQRQASGHVATFDGKRWRLGDDPQPGVHDGTAGGSPWPAFGDALYEKYHVPVGIASTGHSGSGVSEWQPGGALFQHLMARIRQLGPRGFRAVLWHQGETDIDMPSEEYFQRLKTIIETSQKEASWKFPWFVAQASYQNPEHPSYDKPRNAQKKLWQEGIAQEGPDTDKLTGDNRDMGGKGIHFSGKGLRAHGKLWAEKVATYLDKVLGE
jgi:hypothetical protein